MEWKVTYRDEERFFTDLKVMIDYIENKQKASSILPTEIREDGVVTAKGWMVHPYVAKISKGLSK